MSHSFFQSPPPLGWVGICFTRLVNFPRQEGGPTDRHATGRLSNYSLLSLPFIRHFLGQGHL